MLRGNNKESWKQLATDHICKPHIATYDKGNCSRHNTVQRMKPPTYCGPLVGGGAKEIMFRSIALGLDGYFPPSFSIRIAAGRR